LSQRRGNGAGPALGPVVAARGRAGSNIVSEKPIYLRKICTHFSTRGKRVCESGCAD
jgi:hypothetical protein